MRKICFIDMDGVLADFVTGACKAHNKPNPYLQETSKGIFEMDKLWGISASAFWKPLAGSVFFRNLAVLPGAHNLVDYITDVFGLDNVGILTSPSLDIHCVSAKRDWVSRHFPALTKSIIFTGAKGLLAGPGRFLVDDRDENVQSFTVGGGVGVLYPALYNSAHSNIDACLPWVAAVRGLSEGLRKGDHGEE